MSEALGTVVLEPTAPPMFLQFPESPKAGDYSEQTAREIDCEVRRLIDAQLSRVVTLLTSLKPVLLEGASLVLEKEVITGEDLKSILAKHGPVPIAPPRRQT